MAKTKIGVEAMSQIGQAPQGQIVHETPPSRPASRYGGLYGRWSSWLGDPDTRYGRLRRSIEIPTSTKLEMMSDPVIGLCYGFIVSKLLKARYEIMCADEAKRRFFVAMYDRVHNDFIASAAPAVLLGGLGLIKEFAFDTPYPLDPGVSPAWTGDTVPYILTGFEQIHPIGASPAFDEKYKFVGIDHSGGHVPQFFSLWITIGKERAFGGYGGMGRLNYVYGDWWLKQFVRDSFVLHLQKSVDRSVVVGHPEGTHTDGRSFSEVALEVGDAVRGGATVAIPTTTYEVFDVASGESKPTNFRQWTLDVIEASENAGAFHEMEDHRDAKMSLGMFVPPQAYLNVKQSTLGGPTTADVLGELALDLLLEDAAMLDAHLNKYVFPIVGRMNFSPGSPPVEKRTTGLAEQDKNDIRELVKLLAQRMDSAVPFEIDVRRALERLGIPLVEGGGEGAVPVAAGVRSPVALQAGKNPIPQEVLEAIAADRLPDDAEMAAEVTDADLQRVVAALKRDIPELFDSVV